MRRPFPYLVFAVLAGVLSWNCSTDSSSGGGTSQTMLTVTPLTPSVPLGTPQPFTVTDSSGDAVSLAVYQQGAGGACRWSRRCSIAGAADGRLVVEATMRSLVVVVVGPGLEF